MKKKARTSKADLLKKLLETGSFQSLQMEKEIGSKLALLGWQVINGVFYSDPRERKSREVDVVASQFWKKTGERGEQLLRLRLVIECKSIKDFHILISPQLQPFDPVIAHHHWIGFETQIVGRLAFELDKLGLKMTQRLKLMKKLSAIAYPDDFSRIGDLRIEPPKSRLQTSAFRETNIGSEKELDNSVLWRATQSLQSAVSSFVADSLERDLNFILYPGQINLISKQTALNELIQWFTRQSNEVDIWHPIVVLDSSLWTITNGTIEPADWFRLDLIDYKGSREWWCDIVNRSSFNSYISSLTRYYLKSLKAIDAKKDFLLTIK